MAVSPDSIPFLDVRDHIDFSARAFTARGAMAVVVNPAGQLLLNLRDDRPDISHPNCWSILGGLCEDGESAGDALRRELFEEAAITLDGAAPLCRLIDRGGRRHLLTVFVVETTMTRQEMKLAEGRCLQFFNDEQVRRLRLAPFVPALLAFYRDHYR